jgi:inorganic pyrophosphatase
MVDLTAIDCRLDVRLRTCRAVIECPRGVSGKFAYEPRIEAFELKRILPDGMVFPLDFGFIPQTLGEDGDPLDIMVFADQPTPVGVVLTVRLIGVIEAEQTDDGKTFRNDRLLAVAETSRLFSVLNRLDDLDPALSENLTRFWINYEAARGVDFKVLGIEDGAKAVASIIAATT